MVDMLPQVNNENNKVNATVSLGGMIFDDITIKEINLSENLLTPGLQTSVTLQSFIHSRATVKNFDIMKNKTVAINLWNKAGRRASVTQTIYRLDNRSTTVMNLSPTEEFTVHACDQTLLEDAKTLVSKSWRCKSPSDIVRYVLGTCCNAGGMQINGSSPNRDYIAECIHPFQVVAQQANVALDGDDPSFLHYMTYNMGGGQGVHHFKSLKSLTRGGIVKTYYAYESGVLGGQDYNSNIGDGVDFAIAYSFPCDFDLLSDILNGVDESGQEINSLNVFNESSGLFKQLGGGNLNSGCIKSGNLKISRTNKGTADQHNACETDVEKYLLRRQARMSLLEKDKVALRIVGPWDPNLHVGMVINFDWTNKYTKGLLYGSGSYLVSGLNHNIQLGGFATTAIDCVSVTAGGGVV